MAIADCPQGPAGFSNRVGSPPTQPGGLPWLWERPGWSTVVLAATESCEERDSPGIRPCGVTPAWPLSWGAGPPLGYEAAPDRAVRRLNLGGNLRDCGHARLVWIGRNETRMLSLMFVAQVNSGTRIDGMDWLRRFDLTASHASVGPGPPNEALAQGLRYVLIIGSAFGQRPE